MEKNLMSDDLISRKDAIKEIRRLCCNEPDELKGGKNENIKRH